MRLTQWLLCVYFEADASRVCLELLFEGKGEGEDGEVAFRRKLQRKSPNQLEYTHFRPLLLAAPATGVAVANCFASLENNYRPE